MKLLFACALLVTLVSGISYAQPETWQVYLSHDHSFSVELPAPLRKVASFEGEGGANLAPDQKIGWASCYAAIETSPEDSRFGIIIINRRDRNVFLRKMPRQKFLHYMSVILMTDDDRETEPISEIVVQTNGITGKEYIYSAIPTRGRIFDTGSRIYVLVFRGRDNSDLTSPDAERFFSSFRLQRRNKET